MYLEYLSQLVSILPLLYLSSSASASLSALSFLLSNFAVLDVGHLAPSAVVQWGS